MNTYIHNSNSDQNKTKYLKSRQIDEGNEAKTPLNEILYFN